MLASTVQREHNSDNYCAIRERGERILQNPLITYYADIGCPERQTYCWFVSTATKQQTKVRYSSAMHMLRFVSHL